MDKPFRSIDKQIELLNARNVITNDETKSILEREGYYSVVDCLFRILQPIIEKNLARIIGDLKKAIKKERDDPRGKGF